MKNKNIYNFAVYGCLVIFISTFLTNIANAAKLESEFTQIKSLLESGSTNDAWSMQSMGSGVEN